MADFITSDRSLKVGDVVFSIYHKGERLFKITKIERRFLTQDDLRYNVYKDRSVGDEYNPTLDIESIADLSILTDPNKKFRKLVKKRLDAAWVRRADPSMIQDHIYRLTNLLTTIWP